MSRCALCGLTVYSVRSREHLNDWMLCDKCAYAEAAALIDWAEERRAKFIGLREGRRSGFYNEGGYERYRVEDVLTELGERAAEQLG